MIQHPCTFYVKIQQQGGMALGNSIFDESKLVDRSTLKLLNELLEASESIVITAHKSPDGDAVGSSLALMHYLVSQGKRVRVLLPDGFADFLKWMPGAEGIVYFDRDEAQARTLLEQATLIFCLDYNVLSRTGKAMGDALTERLGNVPFVLIDHHQKPDEFANVLISDTTSCSTAQLIYRLIVSLSGQEAISVVCGECLYCGIMTDSGSFRFPSVTSETHEIAAHLIRIGVDHAEIHRKVYDTNLLDRVRLVGYALSEILVVLPEFKTAYITLTQDELKRYNYRSGDTEGLVNQALSIEGVNMAVFIREGNNEVKLSFRSKGSFRVNEFAAELFNGGGHTNAAGGAVQLPIDEVVNRLRSALPLHLDQLDYAL